jgi:hypothetical protein
MSKPGEYRAFAQECQRMAVIFRNPNEKVVWQADGAALAPHDSRIRGNLRELAFEGFGDTGVQPLSRLAQ